MSHFLEILFETYHNHVNTIIHTHYKLTTILYVKHIQHNTHKTIAKQTIEHNFQHVSTTIRNIVSHTHISNIFQLSKECESFRMKSSGIQV